MDEKKRIALTLLVRLRGEIAVLRKMPPEGGYNSAQFRTWRTAVTAQLQAAFGEGHPYVKAFQKIWFTDWRDREFEPLHSRRRLDSIL